MFLLVAGGILAIGGMASTFSAPVSRTGTRTVINSCPGCGRTTFPNMKKCVCGQVLATTDDSIQLKQGIGNALAPAGDTIEQLERLIALKERGALSEQEFQQQKSK